MPEFEKLQRNHLYQQVTNRLEQMIMEESLKVGDKLPAEQVLAERFGVSRNILREAMKTLKARGLIRSGDGSTKGAFVAKPTVDILGDMLNRLVVLGNVSWEHLIEIRLALEVAGAGLAAERSTPDHHARLRELCEKLRQAGTNIDERVGYDLEFHELIAEASGNPLLLAFISPITGLLKKTILEGYRKGGIATSLTYHLNIVDSICARDKAGAEHAMRKHLLRSRQTILGIRKTADRSRRKPARIGQSR